MKAIPLVRRMLLGSAALALLSCGDSAPLAPRTSPSLTSATGLLRCAPLPADSVTQTIGPDGGTLSVGAHRLVVPAGALVEPVSITALAPADTVNQVHFQPEGLRFLRPASLTMSYANCDALASLVPKRIAYTSDALVILEYLVSLDNLFSRTVTGQVQHFSTYAIAW